MKKYITYINESIDTELTEVFKNCAPYIKLLKECDGKMLYREGQYLVDDITEFEHNWYRRPKDTPLEVHEIMNDVFMKEFGWTARSGVFCYINTKYRESGYGKGYLLFPIGDFEYLWSDEIKDMFVDFEMEMMGIPEDMIEDEWNLKCGDDKKCMDDTKKYEEYFNMRMDEYKNDFYLKLEEKIKDFQDSNICKAYYINEIMIKCDSYYMIDLELENKIRIKIANEKI